MGNSIARSYLWRSEAADECSPCADEETFDVPVELINGGSLPVRASAGAGGYDLCSAVDLTLAPDGRYVGVPTGVKLGMGAEVVTKNLSRFTTLKAEIRSRSGLSKKGIESYHGLVDSDYVGEIVVLMKNHTREPFEVAKGDRIAQLVFGIALAPTLDAVESVAALTDSKRGEGGFGSTGTGSVPVAEPVVAAPPTLDEESV